MSFLCFLLRYYKALSTPLPCLMIIVLLKSAFLFLYNCSLQRFTNAAQRCIKAVYRPYGLVWLFFASLRQRSCSSQCRCRSVNAVTKMHCCSERKAAFVQPFCSARCSANKSLKQRCFNVFCIVWVIKL